MQKISTFSAYLDRFDYRVILAFRIDVNFVSVRAAIRMPVLKRIIQTGLQSIQCIFVV